MRNQKGLSLLELTLAMTMFGALVLGGSKLASSAHWLAGHNQGQLQAAHDLKRIVDTFESDIRAVIQYANENQGKVASDGYSLAFDGYGWAYFCISDSTKQPATVDSKLCYDMYWEPGWETAGMTRCRGVYESCEVIFDNSTGAFFGKVDPKRKIKFIPSAASGVDYDQYRGYPDGPKSILEFNEIIRECTESLDSFSAVCTVDDNDYQIHWGIDYWFSSFGLGELDDKVVSLSLKAVSATGEKNGTQQITKKIVLY